MAEQREQRSIYDLITVSEIDDAANPVVLEDIKPVAEIYQELQETNVTGLLSFHGGIKLSHILNKLSMAMAEEVEDTCKLDDALNEADKSFLYGVYLMR